jgi:uncharacterized protein YbjT (DUF2867 family)
MGVDGGTVLVTGASGVIGSRLVERLVREGINPVPAGRRPHELAGRWPDLRPAELDVTRPGTIAEALEGVEVAYYLVHSMEPGVSSFEEQDRLGAASFARAAKSAGVDRVVYLGALGSDEDRLSPHLASRHEVGEILAELGPPVVEFRAAMVVASESASFRLLRDLVDHLPAMIVPRWVDTRSQPIALADVVEYLLAAISLRANQHRTVVEIGGAEAISFREMLMTYAAIQGRTRVIVGVPVLTPRLSSLWCGLTTSVPPELARPLIDGMSTPTVVRDDASGRLFPQIRPVGFRDAAEKALSQDAGGADR